MRKYMFPESDIAQPSPAETPAPRPLRRNITPLIIERSDSEGSDIDAKKDVTPKKQRILRPEAPTFKPPSSLTVYPGNPQQQGGISYSNDTHAAKRPYKIPEGDITGTSHLSKVPCRFFKTATGCRYGAACWFAHDSESAPNNNYEQQGYGGDERAQLYYDANPGLCTREIGNAFVTFTDGAEVASLQLPGDFSSVCLSDLPRTMDIMSNQPSISSVYFAETASTGESPASAGGNLWPVEVECIDQTAAEGLIWKLENEKSEKKDGVEDTSIRTQPVAIEEPFMPHDEREIQMCYVKFSWEKPFRVAVLIYARAHPTRIAVERLQDQHILGRRVNAMYKHDIEELGHRVIVTRLDCRVTPKDIYDALIANLPEDFNVDLCPIDIRVGDPNYGIFSPAVQGDIVRDLCASVGQFRFWEISTSKGNPKTRALAKFATEEEAISVAEKMDGLRVPQFSGLQIRADVVACIRLDIRSDVYNAIERNFLDLYREAGLEAVYIRAYDTYKNPQGFGFMRISGPDFESVMRYKARIGRIMMGSIAKDDEGIIWHPYFQLDDGREFLWSLQEICGSYIDVEHYHRRLRIFGSPMGVISTRSALRTEIRALEMSMRYIELHPDQVKWYITVGSRILEPYFYGCNAVFDGIRYPPSLKITGVITPSVDTALEILRAAPGELTDIASITPGETQCKLCGKITFDPVRLTRCDHPFFTICKICFTEQCYSYAYSGKFPVLCPSLALPALSIDACDRSMRLDDICAALLPQDLEMVLEAAVTAYVKRHSDSLRCCPTNGCEALYRLYVAVSTDSENMAVKTLEKRKTFDCPNCLNILCIPCNKQHEGLACEEGNATTGTGSENEVSILQQKLEKDLQL